MRIVVTGKEGQIASAVAAVGAEIGLDVRRIGRPDLDLTNPSTIFPAIASARPDAIISAAAYTAVDKAEIEPELAYAINSAGAGAVAAAADRLGVPVLHLSTDYVFDGSKPAAYVETDETAPISVYGASKLEGERLVAAATANHAIFRTAWIYSPHGSNFLKTMLRLGETNKSIRVVADQQGCPTSAEDAARALILAAIRMIECADDVYRGTFHLAASGSATWAEFAKAVFEGAERLGRRAVEVVPISSAQYAAPVRRPQNSVLSAAKLKHVHGIVLPDWRLSTCNVVRDLLASNPAKAPMQMRRML